MLGMESEMAYTKKRDFRGYKMKVGKPTLTLQHGISPVCSMPEITLGEDVNLSVDANCTWDLPLAYKYLLTLRN